MAFVAVVGFAASAHAEEPVAWEGSVTGYWNMPKGGDNYGSAIFLASRGSLHLEGRINYEAVHAQSAFVGWTFSLGKEEGVSLELTPIIGGVTGTARGPIAGFEATVSSGRFDFYVEAEHVRDRKDASYNYAWSELGFRPVEWARVGLVGQRTRVYGNDREFQRGGLVQFTHGKATLSAYWFNPGTSDQVVIASLGLSF
jgi:hypothetical protein